MDEILQQESNMIDEEDISFFLPVPDYHPHRIPTGHTCPVCEHMVEADDDAAFLQVVQHEVVTGGRRYHPLTNGLGEFQYEPLFIHMQGCWQDTYHDLEKIVEDCEAKLDLRGTADCDVCGSAIREWEVMVLAQYGEFHTSKRSPDHTKNYIFSHFKDVDYTSEICISCVLNLTGDSLQAWEDLSENGECLYCTHSRCWRVAQCGCECHADRR